jgi:hypothetical protein
VAAAGGGCSLVRRARVQRERARPPAHPLLHLAAQLRLDAQLLVHRLQHHLQEVPAGAPLSGAGAWAQGPPGGPPAGLACSGVWIISGDLSALSISRSSASPSWESEALAEPAAVADTSGPVRGLSGLGRGENPGMCDTLDFIVPGWRGREVAAHIAEGDARLLAGGRAQGHHWAAV